MTYYNPALPAPKARFYNITRVDAPWFSFYQKQTREPFKPYACYEDALNSRWTGPLRWYDEDGAMYQGSHVPATAYQPLHGVQCLPGINWDTYEACDPEELMAYVRTKYTELWGDVNPRYNEEFAVWSIQVHYDGRCR